MTVKEACVGTWVLAAALGASAAEYTVSSGADDGGAGTLRTLVTNAVSGDVISIPEGMAVEFNSRIPITNALELSIVGAGAGATLYGNRASASLTNGLFYVNHSRAKLTFDNLTVTNGYSAGAGGAFTIDNCSNATTFVRCRFLANEAAGAGGVMSLTQKVNLNDCAFSNNVSASYGGCFNLAMDSQYAQNITRSGVLVSTNCVFFGNSARLAGGIASTSEHSRWVVLDIDGWTCVSNVSAQGGCFSLLTTNMIRNCTFEGNAVTGTLGSVAHIFRGSRTVFKGCTFRKNKATNTGVIASRVSTSILDCVFDGNFSVGGGADTWRGSSTLYPYLDSSSGTYIVSNSVFKGESGAIIATAQGATAYTVSLTDCAFYDSVGAATAVSVAHAGSVERCFFGLGEVNPARDTVLLSLTVPAGLTNTVANCTFSRNPATAYSNKRKALNLANTTGNYGVSFCTFVGFAGTEGAVKLSSATDSSTRFRGCAFAENGQRSSGGVLTNAVDLSNAALGVENCCLTMAESKLTKLAGGTYANNLFSADPKLLPLADNGGLAAPDGSRLPTYAFAPTQSPLRNAGGAAAAPLTDARGLPRSDKASGLPDIGAYEYQPSNKGLVIAVY